MNIAFTTCSNNYLAHAKTLSDSFIRLNPEFKFFIGLVDKKSDRVDYSFFSNATVLELDDTIIPNYTDMVSRFNIVELNTAVKPFLFQYLIRQYKANCIYYFDPDIKVYQSIDFMNALLANHSILLTPHYYNPVPIDGKAPFENMALNYGIYNLGFLGVNAQHPESAKVLEWWGERTFQFGYSRVAEGFFVDQLWFNLAPIFFRSAKMLDHYGCNMAPWNLYERTVATYNPDGTIVLDNGEPLVFYHFSSYSFKNPGHPSRYYDRYDFSTMPQIKPLYDDYLQSLKDNNVTELNTIKCALPIVTYEPKLKHKIIRPLVPVMKALWKKI